MRLCFILAICVLTVNALPIDDDLRRETGVNGWYVPQWDGSLKWIGMAEAEAQMAYYEDLEKHESQSRLSTNTVKFYLYTRQNPTQGQLIKATKDSIDASYFNPNNPTRFTIHGWNSNYKDGVNTGVASAWFSYGDYNMIAVDWSRGRSLEYATSVAAVSGAGKKIADLIDYLVKNYQMSLDELEVVGFSLGAHVAGYTAKQVTTGQVRKVVGLDPASPLISYSKPAKRLSSDDAFYVETIQTNGGTLGFTNPIGKASFYPNGGKSQPGCGIDITGSCSHTRAVTYYIECLLNDNYASVKCPTHTDANKKNCGSTYSSVRMGSLANEVSAEGPYYVPLNSVSPYGMGEEISPTPAPTTTTAQEPVTTLKPEVPEETTAAPEENETSKAPEENETSAAPEVPEETTAAPEENETSKAPEENETSAAPEVPEETTAAPEENETSKAPEENETSAAPEVPEETTAAPEDNETTAAPEDNETTAAPEDNETTAAPEDNETTDAPEDNETTAAPEDNETTAAPEDNETTAAPEDNETSEDPEDNKTTSAPEEIETTSTTEDGGWGTPITVPPHDDDDKKGQSKNIYILNLIFMNVNVNGVSKLVNGN
ncbi:endothelial lipase isoform X3 [Drosophila willistoni]|uniref:endothelial lipase isoform X3 n=1 Tax=Drosophila willistoni TaxID=7260 RepID=UPI000C26CF1A|nr:endothelial lipase isoform X3 [Drosophila willistoni]